MKRSCPVAGLVAVVVAATAVVPASAEVRQQHQQVGVDGLTTTVTLITGDVVDVGNGRVHVRRAPGREGVGFRSFTDTRGDLHVVPVDVQARIGSGELDERLFDVSLLARSGYDDASSRTIPLIVQQQQQGFGAASAGALPSIGAHAVEVDKSGGYWGGARAAGVSRVWLDGKVAASLDRSAAQVGAPAAWAKGFTGEGVTVAVLDSGVDESHPDLAGVVVESRNFSDSATTDDRVGHGTHVASTIAGGGRHRGVAPGAKLVSGKVLGDDGGGSESDIIAGMEWAAGRAEIVNMSLGSAWPDEGSDPMSLALNRISAQTGALFVVAAGNSGAAVGSPASADAALTVGAVDRDDRLAAFSSRGPRWGDNAVKPDITAPGVDIVAAKAKNGQAGTPVDEGHVSMSGTSMATPHVAGAAAVLAARHPSWKAEDIKAALMNSAEPNPSLTAYEQGAGRLDVDRAVSSPVTTGRGSFSLGLARWPHDDDEPITRKLVYRNDGASAVTVDLGVTDVEPAATGLFSVSPARLTIPAGGTAEATVSADTRANVPDGVHGAAVVSSGGVRVVVGVVKEVESYDVELTFLDHNGTPTPNYQYRFVDIDQPLAHFRTDPSGTVVQRLPRGRYFFDGAINTYDAGPNRAGLTTALTEPALEVAADTGIVFDARQAVRPSIAVDRADAATVSASLEFAMRTPWGDTGNAWDFPSFDSTSVRPSTTSWPGFEFHAGSVLARPDGRGAFDGSPYQYHVRVSEKSRVPSDVRRSVRDGDLARVRSITHARVPGSVGRRDDGASGPLPLVLQEFYTPDVDWSGRVEEFAELGEHPALGSQHSVAPRVFRLGAPVTEHWNSAVYGPGFPNGTGYARHAVRLGGELLVDVPLFSARGMRGLGVEAGRTTVVLDDEVIADEPAPGRAHVVGAPAEKRRYRVRAEGTRDSQSSKVTADWSFTSEFVPGDVPRPVPLLAVRFAPELDPLNRAGRAVSVPITVERNGVGAVTDVGELAVEVSYDEGGTWEPVPPRRVGGGWQVSLVHPRGAKNVSFRARAADSGGEVRQTVIRAYDLG